MKKTVFLVFIILGLSFSMQAQDSAKVAPRQFMQVTTIESVIGGGIGRSKMLITQPDGSQEEMDLNNLFSIGGINFKNVKENENTILKILKLYADEGWKIEQTIPLTLSPPNNGAGIFMTRYLLSRPDLKKGF